MAGEAAVKVGSQPKRATASVLERRELDLVGGLSKPRPMPWFAWSISAEKCKVGSRLRKVPGSVCSVCYACKGYYSYPVAQAAMQRRFEMLADLLAWADGMAHCLVGRAASSCLPSGTPGRRSGGSTAATFSLRHTSRRSAWSPRGPRA